MEQVCAVAVRQEEGGGEGRREQRMSRCRERVESLVITWMVGEEEVREEWEEERRERWTAW